MDTTNRAKGDCEEEETKCALCGEVDGQRHWMIECGHIACAELKRLGREDERDGVWGWPGA